MLFSVTISEILKYKRTMIPWLTAVNGFFPAFVALLYLLTGNAHVTWETLFITGLGYMNMLSLLLVAVFTGYVFVMEYNNSSINQLFAYPVPRMLFYIDKLVVLLLPVLGSYVAFGITTVIFGWIFADGKPADAGFAADMTVLLLMMAVANYALVPLTAFISMMVKNTGAAILAGVGYFIVFMGFAGSAYGEYILPCIPDRLLTEYRASGQLWSADTAGMLAVCAAAFLVMSCIGAVCYTKWEIG